VSSAQRLYGGWEGVVVGVALEVVQHTNDARGFAFQLCSAAALEPRPPFWSSRP